MPPALFHIILHEPEIPNNTGNIGRTAIATGCALHLIEPLGFDTGAKACRRAGLDYWPRLNPLQHPDWPSYLAASNTPTPPQRWLFTTKSNRPVFDVALHPGDHLIFGKETRGLPDSILTEYPESLVTLPMMQGERSLNLATAVCAAVYEGMRQCLARGDLSLDNHGRIQPRPVG